MSTTNGTASRWLGEANEVLTPKMPRKQRGEKAGKARKPRTRRAALRAAGFLRWTAVAGPCGLAVLLLGVSMPHLAEGFQHTTHCGPLAGWLLAVAIDAAQVIAKLQLTLAAHEEHKARDHANAVSLGIVVSTCLLSIGMNTLAFVSGAQTPVGKLLGGIVGVLLPVLILALSYTASCFALRK
jgi:hypothetical protein